MTERRRTKREEKSYAEHLKTLRELEDDLKEIRLKQRVMPDGWQHLDLKTPCRPRKTRITVALDAEVVRFFRGLGHGYQARMNAVLKAYATGVLAREIAAETNTNYHGDII